MKSAFCTFLIDSSRLITISSVNANKEGRGNALYLLFFNDWTFPAKNEINFPEWSYINTETHRTELIAY